MVLLRIFSGEPRFETVASRKVVGYPAYEFMPLKKGDISFGPPYAALNLSKLGLRYFRIALKVSESSRERLAKDLARHPNVGWIFSAEGWFNLAIGIWARDNAEINDVSAAIRNTLEIGDRVIFQSELTSLYSFGNRALGKPSSPMPILDAVYQDTELSPLELDYIKLIALDASASTAELAAILNISVKEIERIHQKVVSMGVVVGEQDRVNYGGYYLKVFVDTSSKKQTDAVERLTARLWEDTRCIYLERANSTYDLEFEIILDKKTEMRSYLADFSNVQTAILTKNLYTNLYPLSKIANLKQIQEGLRGQHGLDIDLGNSKLWYLSHEGSQGYLSVYEDQTYFEAMERSELDLFPDVVQWIRTHEPDAIVSVIDIGSGDGRKGRVFIEQLGEQKVKAYYPVDVQPIELATALKAHASGTYAKHPTFLDFENLSARFPLEAGSKEKQIYLFLGGTYGNYPSTVINKYLAPVLGPSSLLCIAMPVRTGKTDEELIEQYTTRNIETMAFGPLAQLGFEKQDFERNPHASSLCVQPLMEQGRLRTIFVLKNDVFVSGQSFKKGTRFKMTSSWKPELAEVRRALEADFVIEQMFFNNDMTISLVREKAK